LVVKRSSRMGSLRALKMAEAAIEALKKASEK
jgi:hypothetical protein